MKADRLIQAELAQLYLVQNGDCQRKLEDRLHGRMSMGIEVAIQ
jgi:hypothetical protein